MRVGYFGPPGTFTEEALRASAPDGVEPVPFPTIRATVLAVADGSVEQAVVPIENALEGSVDATLDALAVDAPGVVIVDEVVRPISHCLIGVDGASLDAIAVVLSHPHALGQCTRFLRERLPDARLEAVQGSTAEAVRSVAAAGDPARAAIAPRIAADLYGARVLAAGIEDDPGNQTRFVWLARDGARPAARGEAWKTSVVFWGGGDEAPGWLVRCLSELAFRGVNMTRIESRPRRMGLGHYMFFVDLEGHAEAPAVAEALRGLASHCEGLRTLGTYPSAT
ncbi:MAG: prephenate dehydratase [Solirubrobacteraceae bacterium]|nr:prephenate dehydratase [Solirubrobacteraceae bacterium]